MTSAGVASANAAGRHAAVLRANGPGGGSEPREAAVSAAAELEEIAKL
jgi:hypothetical protein